VGHTHLDHRYKDGICCQSIKRKRLTGALKRLRDELRIMRQTMFALASRR
jgi:hypothetical protein